MAVCPVHLEVSNVPQAAESYPPLVVADVAVAAAVLFSWSAWVVVALSAVFTLRVRKAFLFSALLVLFATEVALEFSVSWAVVVFYSLVLEVSVVLATTFLFVSAVFWYN